MKCRGPKVREEIVKRYTVIPRTHLRLLHGQTKRSDAEAEIKNSYYIFDVLDDNKVIDVIQCGLGAANHFLKLLKASPLPMFDPLVTHHTSHTSSSTSKEEKIKAEIENLTKGNGGSTKDVWNPAARQFYNAIMWLIIAWDAKPGTKIFEEKEKALKYRHCTPYDDRVLYINGIIKKDSKHRTLTQMIEELRQDNEIRDELCHFELLREIVENKKDKAGEPYKSYF